MKRVAFIGAASAWAAANCTDDVLPGLIEVTSDFGFARVAERELVKALRMVENATPQTLGEEVGRAINLISFAAGREIDALRSIEEIYTGSDYAGKLLDRKILQWTMYRESLTNQVLDFGRLMARESGSSLPAVEKPSAAERKYGQVIPAIHADVKGKKFNLTSDSNLNEYLQANSSHPGAVIGR
ncbi:MAG: hypothetical protein IH591_15030, partial [Bacteroidales bacterium]|nr:hypothetical protein [Bacteroidales bacterium]